MISSRRRAIAGAAAPLGLALALLGCGIPTGQDSFERLDEVPNRLNETTTTTTVVTTSTTATTVPDAPESTLAETTTLPPQLVDVFFLSRGDLRAVERPAPSPVTANELILLLEEGPSTQLLENQVDPGLIRDTSQGRGIITIDLDGEIYDGIRERDQRALFAQIVLTFLNSRSGLSGVGAATFTLDGEPQTVPTGSGQFTDDPVSFEDYADMLVDADNPPDTALTVPDDPPATDEPPPDTEPPSSEG